MEIKTNTEGCIVVKVKKTDYNLQLKIAREIIHADIEVACIKAKFYIDKKYNLLNR